MWQEYAINHLDAKEWDKAASGLHNVNSCLVDPYIVKIDSREFYKKIADQTLYKCTGCEKDIHYSKVKVFDLICPMFEGIVTGEKSNKVWICPECHIDCKLKDTIITVEETVQPNWLGVVPAQPVRQIGLQNRFNYEYDFKKWFFNFMEELQHQLGLYRIEYVKINHHDMGDTGYQHKGDDEV